MHGILCLAHLLAAALVCKGLYLFGAGLRRGCRLLIDVCCNAGVEILVFIVRAKELLHVGGLLVVCL